MVPSESSAATICSLGLCAQRHGALQVCSAACSDIGAVRHSNDDLVFADRDCRLFVALDGVGGQAGGAQASRIALNKLRTQIESMCASVGRQVEVDLKNAVKKALGDASAAMQQVAVINPELQKMGTVFALAYVVDDTLLYTRVGDSRVYLVRNGVAKQLTQDETYVQLMVDAGVIPPEQVSQHPMRNVILNAVGAQSAANPPSVQSCSLRPGDTVLLTTDGVTDSLGLDELATVVRANSSPQTIADSLVQAAIEGGSRDNASCVVIQFAANPQRHAETSCQGSRPSTRDDLRAELDKLHTMLVGIESVDEELRGGMEQIARDLQHALRDEDPVDEISAAELGRMGQEIRERALAFEVSHPYLTTAAASIADMLARMGI